MIPRNATDHYYKLLGKSLDECSTILDVGCGPSSPLTFIRRRAAFRVGADAHFASLQAARSSASHDAYLAIDLSSVSQVLRPQSFDAVLALDVVEHFPKDEAWELLAHLEQVARRRIILMTPCGFVPQPPDPSNPLQEHLSGWSPQDLRSAGYHVQGLRGLRFTRGMYAIPTLRPRSLGEKISYATQPFARLSASWAYQLLAIKDLTSRART